jgi:hypothetical protein
MEGDPWRWGWLNLSRLFQNNTTLGGTPTPSCAARPSIPVTTGEEPAGPSPQNNRPTS